jgi:hypothetical protein
MEHRWGKRSALDVAVRLRRGSGAVDTGRIANASLSGVFVRTTTRLPVFTRVLVELDGSGARQSAPERIPAYVVRAAPDGLGLEWSEFAPSAVDLLSARTIAVRSRNAGMQDVGHRSPL